MQEQLQSNSTLILIEEEEEQKNSNLRQELMNDYQRQTNQSTSNRLQQSSQLTSGRQADAREMFGLESMMSSVNSSPQ